jgi:hypothetical protein
MPSSLGTTLRIAETGNEVGGGSWQAEVQLDGGSPAAVLLVDPFVGSEEQRLRWYLENHLELPLINTEWASRARDDVRRYGRSLFSRIFTDPDAQELLLLWNDDPGRVEIRGSAAFHRLHWETLWGEHEEVPMAARVPFVRVVASADEARSDQPAARESPDAGPDTDIAASRILLLTARSGPGDVPVRAVSRPLRNAIMSAVPVDTVHPGTFRGLREHLQRHPVGRYPILHLDLHGAVRGPADQRQAFVVFEADGDDDGWVSAARLAAVLRHSGVSLVVLTACQTGMPAEGGMSFAAQLLDAGLPAAIGMSFVVTVDAAARYTAALYGTLARTADLNRAQTAARAVLFDDQSRLGSFGNRLQLDDWLLPIVYQADSRVVRLPLPVAETVTAADPAGDLPGRDYDITCIERRLVRCPRLLLSGLTGIGKTALLRQLRREWPVTGFAQRCLLASCTGFDAATTYESLSWLHRQVATPVQAVTNRAAAMRDLLRAPDTVLLLDQADDMYPADLDLLLNGLLGAAPTLRIVVASRSGWSDARQGWTAYRLQGIPDPTASAVIGAMVGARRLGEIADDMHFGRLLRLVNGHPATLEIVAPLLADQSPAEIIVGLQAGSVAPRQVDAADAVFAAVAALPPPVRRRILALAPFVTAIPPDLDSYLTATRDTVDGDTTTPSADEPAWRVCAAEAVRAGLLEPALPGQASTAHPLLGCVLRHQASEARSVRYRLVHRAYFQQVAEQIFGLLERYGDDAKLPAEQTTAQIENLEVALADTLASGGSPTVLFRAVDAVRNSLGRSIDRLTLAETVWAALAGRPLSIDHLICLERRSAMLGAVGRYTEAEQVFQQTLDVATTLPGLAPEQRDGAVADLHHQRGILEHRQRRFEVAARELRAALVISAKDGRPRPGDGKTWHLLGEIELEQGRSAAALDCFTRALALKERPVERRKTLARLIDVLVDRDDREAAELYYRHYYRLQATEQLAGFDSAADAVEWNYLSARMEILRENWAAADEQLHEALSGAQAHASSLAPKVLHQLAVVALAQDRLNEACFRLEQGARLAQEAEQRSEAAQILSRLERVYRQTNRSKEADGVAARAELLLPRSDERSD